MRHYLVIAALVIGAAAITFQSCKKKKNNSPIPLAVTHLDTIGILTNHCWELSAMWRDANHNGIVDTSTELGPYPFPQIYTFLSNGVLLDTSLSPALASKTGAWYFQPSDSATLNIAFDSIDYQQYVITHLTDTSIEFNVLYTSPVRHYYYRRY